MIVAPFILHSANRMMLFAEIKRRRWLSNYNRIRESSFKEMEKPVDIQDYIVYDKEKKNDE